MKKREKELFIAVGKIDDSLIEELYQTNNKPHSLIHIKKKILIAAVIMLSVVITIPNLSADIAYAAYKIPILGEIFKVVTFRAYDETSGNLEIKGELPKIDTNENASAESVNDEMEAYVTTLIDRFKSENKSIGSLDFKYEVITNDNTWFTIGIFITEIQASARNSVMYYHIDKTTGSVIQLSDLFDGNESYIDVINDNIIYQMEERMKKDTNQSYFIGEDGFTSINENHNFYFNGDGNLVIVFDEYDVAPGYMGVTEFEILREIISY